MPLPEKATECLYCFNRASATEEQELSSALDKNYLDNPKVNFESPTSNESQGKKFSLPTGKIFIAFLLLSSLAGGSLISSLKSSIVAGAICGILVDLVASAIGSNRNNRFDFVLTVFKVLGKWVALTILGGLLLVFVGLTVGR